MRGRWMVKVAAAVVVMVAAIGATRALEAQTIDPITGVMVMPADPTADPTTYAEQMTQNAILQSDQATYQAQQSMQQAMQASQDAMQAAQQASQDAMNAASSNDDIPPAPMVVRTPKTPKPTLVSGANAVTIQDADPSAVLFYTTDGKKPTTSSARYAGPIAIHGKVKVEALAFDVNDMPSSVVSKTFKAAN